MLPQAHSVSPCSVYERAFRSLRESQPDAKEEAVMLLEAWRTFEQTAEGPTDVQKATAVEAVERRMPKRIKKKRRITTDDGLDAGMEVSLVLNSWCCLMLRQTPSLEIL